MPRSPLNILLADDDKDDCFFFQEAVEELTLPTTFKETHDGEQLMQYLTDERNEMPSVIFLDINMPRKNGFECLREIKRNEKLKQLPVIIFSTSYDEVKANQLYEDGAHYYIRKPSDFEDLKKVIEYSLHLISGEETLQPLRADFLLNKVKMKLA